MNLNENLIQKNGQQLAMTIKMLCVKEQSRFNSLLDYNNDSTFIHPAFISYFNKIDASKMSFDQVAYGFLPKRDNYEIQVTSDEQGIIYLPNMGFINVYSPGLSCTITTHQGQISITNTDRKAIKFSYTPYTKIEHSNTTQIFNYLPTIFKHNFKEFYRGEMMNPNPTYTSKADDAYGPINRSYSLLKKYFPQYYDLLESTTQFIYVHDNPRVLNFVSYPNHGIIYLYMLDDSSVVYFLEELLHQGGHNYFNILTFKKGDFFKIDVENMLIGPHINKPSDYRTIFSVIHGLISISIRVEGFERLLAAEELSGLENHELRGRYADQIPRFESLGIQYLNFKNIFTPLGLEYFEGLMANTKAKLAKREKEFSNLDISWRDLDFRLNTYLKHNPFPSIQKDTVINA